MRVLTWNLFHGRSVPDTPRSLLAEFAEAIAGWAWDVALLQEVPPWWPRALALAAGAAGASAPTSRTWLLPLRRLAAERRPDLIKAGGGGANAILVRGRVLPGQRVATLRRLPERRIVHGVRLADGTWVSNLHAQAHLPAAARADAARAGALTLQWAAGAPAVLGGDFNHRDPRLRAHRPRPRPRAAARGPRAPARARPAVRPPAGARRAQPRARRPKPRSMSSARSLSVPRPGRTPSWTAAS
jgi:endonuclease/exonuclease/phosphatase family metal-dependent hydrolase